MLTSENRMNNKNTLYIKARTESIQRHFSKSKLHVNI